MIERDVFRYWTEKDRDFSTALRQIEYEERDESEPDSPLWTWIMAHIEAAIGRGEVDLVFNAVFDLPIGQSLYLVRMIRDESRPLLEKMAVDDRAGLVVARINQAVNRRWILRVFSEKSTDLLAEKVLEGGE